MQFYLVSDVATAWGVSDTAIRKAEARGELPAYARTVGGVRIFDAATVERVRRARDSKRQRAAGRL